MAEQGEAAVHEEECEDGAGRSMSKVMKVIRGGHGHTCLGSGPGDAERGPCNSKLAGMPLLEAAARSHTSTPKSYHSRICLNVVGGQIQSHKPKAVLKKGRQMPHPFRPYCIVAQEQVLQSGIVLKAFEQVLCPCETADAQEDPFWRPDDGGRAAALGAVG